MNPWRSWAVWAKFLFGTLIAYSALLCCVSLSVLVQALRSGWALKPLDLCMQGLMTSFLPILLVGFRNQRLASGLLLAGAVADIAMFIFISNRTGDGTAAMLVGSLLFLGVPMLGSALLLRRLSPKRI